MKILWFPCVALCLILCSCSTKTIEGTAKEYKKAYFETDKTVRIPKDIEPAHPYSPPIKPRFKPQEEELSPLRERIVHISVRSTPLRDVIYIIAQVCGLNLSFEKGVNVELPITIQLKNVTAEYALNEVLSSADYFWEVKGQMLVIKAEDTRIFELSIPSFTQTYDVGVGGDMLGGAAAQGGSTIKGNISQSIKADEAALSFWSSLEEGLSSILGTGPGGSSSFVINRVAGTVQITATRKKLENAQRYIEHLTEVMNRQVIIEAKVVEVNLNEDFSYGINWNLIASGLNLSTEGFAGVVPSGSRSFSGQGMRIINARTSLEAIIRAIEQQGDVRTLSSPRLNIMNGQTALLSIGTNQTYLSRVETTTTTTGTVGTTTFTVETSSILSGIMIGLIPFINEKGEIYLTITPIISDLVSLNQKNLGGQLEISLPTVELRELSTTVKARDSETIVLGGLIAQKEVMRDDQVPVLGRIPILGLLFKSREKISKKTELVVLLQPRIVTR